MKNENIFSAPPKVSILGKPKSNHFTLTENSELALVCLVRTQTFTKISSSSFNWLQGSGEPAPSLSWSKEGGPLPDGQTQLQGDQLIFSAVTRDHQGTYVCSGDTDTGAGDRDSVTVTVNCEHNSKRVQEDICNMLLICWVSWWSLILALCPILKK